MTYILVFGNYYSEKSHAHVISPTLKDAHTRLRAAGYRKRDGRTHRYAAYYEIDDAGLWCRVVKSDTEIPQ